VGTAIKHHVPLTLRAECQSARMTKITDDGLIPCGLAHAHCAGQLTEIFWGYGLTFLPAWLTHFVAACSLACSVDEVTMTALGLLLQLQ